MNLVALVHLEEKITDHLYPHFRDALLALAPTVPAIAEVLGLSVRSVHGYLAGETLPHVAVVKRFPTLDDALSRDIRGGAPIAKAQRRPIRRARGRRPGATITA